MLLLKEDMSDNQSEAIEDDGGGGGDGKEVEKCPANKKNLKLQTDFQEPSPFKSLETQEESKKNKKADSLQVSLKDSFCGQRRSYPGWNSNEESGSSSCRALRRAVSTLTRLDDFTYERIGTGFFSEVFKVTHRVNGSIMVLKMNTCLSNRNNMIREIQLMNKLSHPNILKYYGACVHEGQLHALTEHMSGGSLEQLLCNKNVELSWSIRGGLAKDIASGMNYLHSKGFFHRDLTSKNILIRHTKDSCYTAVVADFGLAEKIPDPLSMQRLPTVGSPYWMAPECLKGQWYNEKADVFSYGIILCEIIARIEADPDILPRLENFGLDAVRFKAMCPDCLTDLFSLAVKCCAMKYKCRPSFAEIEDLLKKILNDLKKSLTNGQSEAKVSNRRSLSEDDLLKMGEMNSLPCSPSDKARCHFSPSSSGGSDLAANIIKRDCSRNGNPFSKLEFFSNGRKILPLSKDQFSSCLELQSPSFQTAPATPLYRHEDPEENSFFLQSKYKFQRSSSVPVSPTTKRRTVGVQKACSRPLGGAHSSIRESNGKLVGSCGIPERAEYRRRGSCESGFFSVGDSERMSTSDLSPEPSTAYFEDPICSVLSNSNDGETNYGDAKSVVTKINVASDYSSSISCSSSSSSSSSSPSTNFNIRKRPVQRHSPRPLSCPRIACPAENVSDVAEQRSIERSDNLFNNYRSSSQYESNNIQKNVESTVQANVAVELPQLIVPTPCQGISSS